MRLRDAIRELRTDPRFKKTHLVEVIKVDPAGEWHTNNQDFMQIMRDEHVHVDMRPTSVDKRHMATGEGAVRIMELMVSRIMIQTRLEAEMWEYAYTYAALMKNLHTRVKDASPDGNGPRPLEVMSKNFVSREHCDKCISYAVVPGTTAYVTVKRSSGSSVKRLARTRVARALRMHDDSVVWECPHPLQRGVRSDSVHLRAEDACGASAG